MGKKIDITENWYVVSCYSNIVLVQYIITLLEERTNWARCSENFRVFFLKYTATPEFSLCYFPDPFSV